MILLQRTEAASTMTEPNYRWVRTAGTVSSIALLILASTGIGLGLGVWLDGKLGTKPWLAFALTLVGLISGLYESVVILIKATREQDD
ncbi:MAG: hypothetical protein A2Z18_05820 [Armatimonadetes bacterium RBG_16_58_9]|nr:MAG: hypothetical protein A2Z18_05820 [Armatimonadetes bacterium RBG_16_58_9]